MKASHYDVLIIGAGAAGLAAGRMLAQSGLRAAIIEARDRVGGRILTRQIAAEGTLAPLPVELGAEFIHGRPPATWSLIAEAELKTFELDGSQLWYDGAGLRAAPADRGDAFAVLEQLSEWLARQPPGRDMSFSEYASAAVPDRDRAEAAGGYVEGFNAADRERIGIASLAEQQRAEDAIEGDRLFRLEAGYEALPNYLAQEFVRAGGNVLLAKPVHKIAWRRGAVSVEVGSRDGRQFQLHAERAVVSVPLGVLNARSIEFAPRPDAMLEQAQRLAMGSVARAVLIFRRRFWLDAGARHPALAPALGDLSFLMTPSELPATWWTPMPHDTPMLTAWSGGPKSLKLERRTLLAQCLKTLAKVFEIPAAELEAQLSSWHHHDWQADEFTRGAYSYVPAGALDAPARLATPLDDTLYFAGEHTDTSGHWGTVHAALASGERAARQVLAATRARGGSAIFKSS